MTAKVSGSDEGSPSPASTPWQRVTPASAYDWQSLPAKHVSSHRDHVYPMRACEPVMLQSTSVHDRAGTRKIVHRPSEVPMYAKPHRRAESARDIRVYNAQRKQREQARRNAAAMARVAGMVHE